MKLKFVSHAFRCSRRCILILLSFCLIIGEAKSEELIILDTLPVVVHVIHTGTPIGSPGNPSNASINALITQMNNAFQKNGPNYGGANIGLAFALATQTPTCTATNGINRVNGSGVNNYVTGGITTNTNFYPNSAHELLVKALSRWPNTDYINIWIVNMIDGNPSGIAGYAYFPEYNSALTDGIVLRADAVNGTNKTIIHELGHYFNLDHTFGAAWEMCIAESNCATQGDLVCDTEAHRFTYDCTEDINPCSMDEYIIADAAFNYTVLNNYMGYTDCQWMFTEGQKTRILNALNTFRPGLLSSLGVSGSLHGTPVSACTPAAVNGLSQYYGIQRFEFASLNVYSNSSMADGNFYFDRTCNQQVIVQAGQNVLVRVTGSFENYQQVKVFIDFDNDGVFEAPGELILNDYGGIVEDMVTMPSTQVDLCAPLRMRVITDHPSAPEVTACLLTGTPSQGVGQIEDYTVIINPRQVNSVSSGNWNNPAIWSCNCIPAAGDAIRISAGHLVIVPLILGTVQCASVRLQPGAELRAFANVNVTGGCL